MSISSLALAAKKVIDAAWLHGDAYDLSSQAAFALESAQLLQSPETAAEHVRAKYLEAAATVADDEVEELRAERADRQDEVAAAVGYTSGLEWSDLVSIVASNTTSLVRAERDVRALRARVAELENEKRLVEGRERDELLTRFERVLAPFCADPQGAATAVATVRDHEAEFLLRDAQRVQDRVNELEAERHTTNEALDDAVQALRAQQVPDVDRSADRLTRLLAPTQALREDDEFGLHHAYRVGRDLPEPGGAK